MSLTEKDAEKLVASCTFLVLAVPIALYASWVYALLWSWFVVPFGVMAVSTWHMFGLGVLISAMTKNVPSSKGKDDSAWTPLMNAILSPTFALAFGALAHGVMR